MKTISKTYLFTLNLLICKKLQNKFVFSKIFYSKIRTSDCFKPTFPYINIPKNLQLYFQLSVVYFALIFYTHGLDKRVKKITVNINIYRRIIML